MVRENPKGKPQKNTLKMYTRTAGANRGSLGKARYPASMKC